MTLSRIMVWAFVVSLATALVASAVGYVVTMRGGTSAQMLLAMFLVFGASGIVFAPKCRSALRRAGYGVEGERKMTPRLWCATIGSALTIVGAVALCDLAYARSGNRLLEALVALLPLPVVIWLTTKAYGAGPRVRPQDAEVWRWAFMGQLVLPIVFGINLALQLFARHPDVELEPFRNLLIASDFVVIALSPVIAFFTRRRYVEASRSARA